MADIINGVVLMRHHSEVEFNILDQITITNRGWYTQKAKKNVRTYDIGDFSKHRVDDDFMVTEIVQLRTKIGLLMKHFATMNSVKVNVVGS